MSCATPILPYGPLGHDPETASHVRPKYAPAMVNRAAILRRSGCADATARPRSRLVLGAFKGTCTLLRRIERGLFSRDNLTANVIRVQKAGKAKHWRGVGEGSQT